MYNPHRHVVIYIEILLKPLSTQNLTNLTNSIKFLFVIKTKQTNKHYTFIQKYTYIFPFDHHSKFCGFIFSLVFSRHLRIIWLFFRAFHHTGHPEVTIEQTMVVY